MSESFICRRGGSGTPFAVIGVTYPEGSTCTCSDGTKTLTAKGTSGRAIFNIPYAAMWTVSCTDGTDTASESVSITADGQSANLELRYDLPLWDNGSVNEDVTGGWSGNAANENNCGEDYKKYIYIQSSAYGAATAKTANMIDVTEFNTLKVNVVAFSKSGGNGKVGLSTNSSNPNSNDAASRVFSSNISTPTEFSIDISSLSGEYCVYLWGNGGNNNYGENVWACSLKVDKIILE